jgi:hypothetical protein
MTDAVEKPLRDRRLDYGESGMTIAIESSEPMGDSAPPRTKPARRSD